MPSLGGATEWGNSEPLGPAQRELSEKHEAEVGKKHWITEAEQGSIAMEGIKKNWPRPQGLEPSHHSGLDTSSALPSGIQSATPD
jgi:hypothetical protein